MCYNGTSQMILISHFSFCQKIQKANKNGSDKSD